MLEEYKKILVKSRGKEKEIHKQMFHLTKFNRSVFDNTVAAYHKKVFETIDCLSCGNCCRVKGPRFREKDIKILSKEIGLSPKEFNARYLTKEPDLDYSVLSNPPCPFLNEDNTCSDYDKRPLWCEEFPHTNIRNVQRSLVRLGHTAMYCPAAALIVQMILEEY